MGVAVMLNGRVRPNLRPRPSEWQTPAFRIRENLAKGVLHWEAAQKKKALDCFRSVQQLALRHGDNQSYIQSIQFQLPIVREDGEEWLKLIRQALDHMKESFSNDGQKEFFFGLAAMQGRKWGEARRRLVRAAWQARREQESGIHGQARLQLCYLDEVLEAPRRAAKRAHGLLRNRRCSGFVQLEAMILLGRCLRRARRLKEARLQLECVYRFMARGRNWAFYDWLLRELYDVHKEEGSMASAVLADLLLN